MSKVHHVSWSTDHDAEHGSQRPVDCNHCDKPAEQTRTRVDKVNAELFTLTYGTMVAQMCSDYDQNYVEVNKQLDKMGFNIGMRLVEDYFAKSGTQRCANFRDTAEAISKVSPMFMSHCKGNG